MGVSRISFLHMLFSRVLLLIVSGSLLVNGLETSVSLRGSSDIRITSTFKNLPIAVSTDPDIPLGTATILIGSSLHLVDINDIFSELNDGTVDIYITSQQSFSSSPSDRSFSDDSNDSDDSTSAGNVLRPAIILVMVGAILCLTKNKFLGVAICVCLFSAAAYSLDFDNKIVITISPFEDIERITVISPESVIVAEDLVNLCESGRSTNSLSRCNSMVCDVDDSDCISSDFIPVGVLLALNDIVADNYRVAIEKAATEFGKSVPHIQLIIGNTGDTPESAVETAERLYNLGCTYFVGPMYSGEALAVLEWAKTLDEELMFISPSASSLELENYDNFVSMFTSNHEFSKAVCNYVGFTRGTDQFHRNKIFAINANLAYTSNLLELTIESCLPMRIDIVSVASYDDISSVEDAIPIINSLNSFLEEEEDLTLDSILHFGFSEAKYLADAANQVGGKVQQVQWFSSDAAFDDSVLESPVTRENASKLRLSGLYYVGFRADQQVALRSETLEAIIAKSGSVDLLSTFVHDASMLMYLTLERMGSLLSKPAVFPSYVKQTADETYGVTGYLGITALGFRSLGEYMAGEANVNVETLNMPWQPTVFELYEGAGLPSQSIGETIHFDIIKYYEFTADQFVCNSTMTLSGGYRDYLGRMFLVSGAILPDTKLLIPKFSNFTLNIFCGEILTIYACPGGTRNDFTRCLSVGIEADSNKALDTNPVSKMEITQEDYSNVFKDEVVFLPKQDNMFGAYDGAKGTTLDYVPVKKPVDSRERFP